MMRSLFLMRGVIVRREKIGREVRTYGGGFDGEAGAGDAVWSDSHDWGSTCKSHVVENIL
ncbi:hypothetical protein KDH_75720 [Dictyobacter sp. S3.2.2.5]|uniref:Uncharacterized protein n=1 Tax=Dictyobacter halimunensis TaxID=3026934 RepID=A0ABQ6G4J7_9CHLR|nr:hypothetical protein KDH_75720 [Dictyobacter sp. S3.2.2.5]